MSRSSADAVESNSKASSKGMDQDRSEIRASDLLALFPLISL